MKKKSRTGVSSYPFFKVRIRIALLALAVLFGTAFNTFSQQRSVTGRITDGSAGGPMPGVNIQVKGTTVGSISDVNGGYSLVVPGQNATLVFSFIGYTTRELLAGDQNVINVALTPELTGLEEVVVIGYGTVQKKDLTGSVSQVQAKTLKDLSVTRVDQALTGKMAGRTGANDNR
jgi:TonB-dependent starch-binding outer membrane protein SusC